ncbi:branched-chain amino acid ABC transporter permease [Microbacterium sp. RD1]|uniref:branched-chain amino acid ABC transporter permease n=1 Tax=Microbacterium sp. RD1 TaxID=3457313 RepID=UPI003FA5A79B
MSAVLNAAMLGIAIGSLYALLGVSFSVIYTPTKIFHFAHGAVIVAAGYAAYTFIERLGLPLPIGVLGAIVVAVVLGVAIELLVYRTLRRRSASHLIVFIASASVLTLVAALITMAYGLAQVSFSAPVRPAFDGAPLTNAQLTTIIVAVVIIVPLAIFLKRSPWGIRFRAVGDAPEAAQRRGVNIPRVYLVSFVLGSAIAVPAAILQGWATGFRPEMGFHDALIATATTLVAGSRGVLAVAAAGVGIGLVQGMSLLVFPSSWQDGVTYFLLFLVIVVPSLVRRRGLVHA